MNFQSNVKIVILRKQWGRWGCQNKIIELISNKAICEARGRKLTGSRMNKGRKGKHQSWGRLRARDVRNVAVLGPNFDACPCKGLQKRKEEV